MPPLNLRPAAPPDIPALHALVESAYRGDSARRGWTHEADLLDGQRIDTARLGAILDDPHETILLGHHSDQLVACVQVTLGPHARAYLGLLSIAPQRQAEGLGKHLILAAEMHARAHGALVMEMSVIKQRAELIAYYTRRGYKDSGKRAPFPYGDEGFGLPRRDDLEFRILTKSPTRN
jgi:ribosomal protein S18 acetylase RimI-like enzyme